MRQVIINNLKLLIIPNSRTATRIKNACPFCRKPFRDDPDPVYEEDPDYEVVIASSVEVEVDFDENAPPGSKENPIVIILDGFEIYMRSLDSCYVPGPLPPTIEQ